MKTLIKKNIQILQEFHEALSQMAHGQQQEAVNAALTMFFMGEINQKRFCIRLFRELRDGNWVITPHPSGHGASFAGLSEEELKRWKETKQRLFAGPPAYFDEGLICDLPLDLRAEKVPRDLLSKKQQERMAAEGSGATKVVEETASRKPKPRRRRKAGGGD